MKKGMILVVDDTRENIFSMLRLLESNGFEAEAAWSGEEALRKALKTDYSLIILDVQMPGMDGFEVAQALAGNNKTKDIPIIFLSAVNTSLHFITRGYSAGGIDYLTKPFDPEILLLKVASFQRLYAQTKALQQTQTDLLAEIATRKKAEAQKDIFVSMASHELKTPLTSLKGYLQMLEKMHANMDKADLGNFLHAASKQVNKLGTLINELLDISQIDNGKLNFKFSHFEFEDILTQTVATMRQIYPDNVFPISGNAKVMVYADPVRIEQVITNYLSNAVKYSPGQKEICINAAIGDNDVTLTVTDKGIGIPADHQSRIFSKFYRVEESSSRFHGLGIGLYICADIIDRHDGTYGVTSEPGNGSSFYFTLPVQKNTLSHETRVN